MLSSLNRATNWFSTWYHFSLAFLKFRAKSFTALWFTLLGSMLSEAFFETVVSLKGFAFEVSTLTNESCAFETILINSNRDIPVKQATRFFFIIVNFLVE